jgi:hypothetical protein
MGIALPTNERRECVRATPRKRRALENKRSPAPPLSGIRTPNVRVIAHRKASPCESLLTFFLAGPEAEKEFCGASDDGGDRIDVHNARRYLARQYAPLHIGFQLLRYRDAAQRLVRSAWAQQRIRVLADALAGAGDAEW